MKKTVITLAALAFSLTLKAQWNGASNPISTTYSVGIGTSTPDQKLEVETSTPEDGIIVTQTSAGGAGLHLRNNYNSGHDWALYSLNGSNTPAGGHFIIYDHTNSEYRFMIDGTNGNIGIGTIYPDYKLHLSADDGNMSNNPIGSNSIYQEPSHWGGYFEYQGTNALGVNASLMGYNLNNKSSTGGNLTEGIGLCGKAERTSSSSGNTQCIGVKGFASGASTNVGGVFVGGSSNYIGGKLIETGNSITETNIGIFATASGVRNLASYFNGGTYSNSFYQCAETRFIKESQSIENPLTIISELKPIKFTFNVAENNKYNLPKDIQYGLNVTDLERVLPSLIFNTNDLNKSENITTNEASSTFKSVNYINLVPILIAAIQEQQRSMQSFSTEVNELKNLVQLQNEKLQELERIGSRGEVGSAQTKTLYLDQNIPNPFKGETEIKYLIPKDYSSAELLISDLTGKNLFSINVETGIEGKVKINSEKLNAGLYYYTLVSGGRILVSKQMIVAN